MNAFDVRQEVITWLNYTPKLNGCAIPSSGERGVVTGLLNNCLKLDHDIKEANIRRHQVLAWLFRDVLNKPMASGISAKELSNEMWWALCKYVEPHKDMDSGQWYGKEGLCDEIVLCWKAMLDWESDMNKQLGFEI